MGWSDGTDLIRRVIEATKQNFGDDEARSRFYEKLIDAFEDHDWDGGYLVIVGIDRALDKLLRELNPDAPRCSAFSVEIPGAQCELIEGHCEEHIVTCRWTRSTPASNEDLP